MAWLTGMTPPSAAPISSRAPNSIMNDEAAPETKEHKQNAIVATTTTGFFEPRRSDMRPTRSPEMAQVSESAELNIPTWVLVRFRSGCTKGMRKLSALRSKNRMPKFRLSSTVNQTW